jgi:hypothetical protein
VSDVDRADDHDVIDVDVWHHGRRRADDLSQSPATVREHLVTKRQTISGDEAAIYANDLVGEIGQQPARPNRQPDPFRPSMGADFASTSAEGV